MGDDDHRDLAVESGDGLHHAIFGFGVEGAGGFIEDEQFRFMIECSCQADALALAAGEADAAFTDEGVEARGQFVCDEVEDLGGGGGALEGGGVDFFLGDAEGDVGGD